RTAVLDGIADGGLHEAMGAKAGDGLDADSGALSDRFLGPELLVDEGAELLRLLRPGAVLDARVHVLRILAEDDDVELLRLPHRRRHPGEPAHRPDAGVEVQLLTQRHVDG